MWRPNIWADSAYAPSIVFAALPFAFGWHRRGTLGSAFIAGTHIRRMQSQKRMGVQERYVTKTVPARRDSSEPAL